MKQITIYTIRTEDHYRLGTPAAHTLTEPETISRTWIDRAEYMLPKGYEVAASTDGTPAIYNATGKHCDIIDSAHYGIGGGAPVLIDNAANPRRVTLTKVRDLPW